MATAHCGNRAQLCIHECVVCTCVNTVRGVSQTSVFQREGAGLLASCTFKKLAFDCNWQQLK